MGASKIVDEQEVKRWFEEGKTYAWMVEEYARKYGIETSISMWGNHRRRQGYDRRTAWDQDLIPWAIEPQHRYSYPIIMLRREARRRAGFEMTPEQQHEIDVWIAGMTEADAVLHYDPDTEEGWFYVPRREGVDTDLIRDPGRKTGKSRRVATTRKRTA